MFLDGDLNLYLPTWITTFHSRELNLFPVITYQVVVFLLFMESIYLRIRGGVRKMG